ncbi:MAG TPA: hypothetical protein VHX44_11005 [Planctomycetota bacterium]|nr:hypothetical protein [Planctomycetota bacterium]
MALPTLSEQPAWIGVLLIAGSFLPLLMGWRLIRWTTMLLSTGVVIGVVLFLAFGHLPTLWAWVTAVSCGVLAGAVGWFLYPLIAGVQSCVLAAGMTILALQHALPSLPALAYGLGCGVGTVAGILGWRAAAASAIIQTVLLGYLGVAVGMAILCRPASQGEGLVLAAVVALVTMPAGAWVQWRAHRREQQP